MRIFAIPDIHGMFHLLERLLETLYKHHNLDLNEDKLIFLGDYVDRGLDSFLVLSFLYKLQKAHPKNVVTLAGNHEHLMLDFYNGEDKWGLWLINGGVETMGSFSLVGLTECPRHLQQWIADMPLYHKEEGFFFSHAPVPAEQYRRSLNFGQEFTKEELIWSYSSIATEEEFARDHGNGVIGVCGHIHALRKGIKAPRFYDHYIYADAGCGCSKDAPLCAINVHTREVIYSA